MTNEKQRELGELAISNPKIFQKAKREKIANLLGVIMNVKTFNQAIKTINLNKASYDFSNIFANAIFLDSFIRRLFPLVCDIYPCTKERNEKKWLLWAIKWMIKKSPDTFSWLGRLKQAEKSTDQTIIVPAFPLVKTAKKSGRPLNANDWFKCQMAKDYIGIVGNLKRAEYDLKRKVAKPKAIIFKGVETKNIAKVLQERTKEWKMVEQFRLIQKHGVQNEADFWIAIYLGEEPELMQAEKWYNRRKIPSLSLLMKLYVAQQRLELLRKIETEKTQTV